MPRQHDDITYKAMKAAFRRLIAQNGGYCAAAAITRVGKSQLQEYASVHHMGVFAPIDVVIDLERAAGDPTVSRQMIRLLADADTPEPDHEDDDPDDLGAVLWMTTRGQVTLGDLAHCAMQAAADGELDDRELDDLIHKAAARMDLAASDHDSLLRLRDRRQARPRSQPRRARG